ncbi:response regulator [Sphingomonas sp.]|uniref:response regulator n=1 Tax=Sphingomonas sp. TaxID=28214 RepID=UPI0025E8B220|nr:response regulator [Sphingomonas sp.]
MIAEDSDLMAKILTRLIERRGWSVAGRAVSAREVLPVVRAAEPDLVTLDLNLPEGGSLELIAGISELAVPVVVISAATYEGSPATAEAFRHGASACVDKSRLGQPEELWAALEAAREQAGSPASIDAPRTGATAG